MSTSNPYIRAHIFPLHHTVQVTLRSSIGDFGFLRPQKPDEQTMKSRENFQKITGGVTLSTTTTCVTGGQYLQELTLHAFDKFPFQKKHYMVHLVFSDEQRKYRVLFDVLCIGYQHHETESSTEAEQRIREYKRIIRRRRHFQVSTQGKQHVLQCSPFPHKKVQKRFQGQQRPAIHPVLARFSKKESMKPSQATAFISLWGSWILHAKCMGMRDGAMADDDDDDDDPEHWNKSVPDAASACIDAARSMMQ
ncbi:hypothetical protein OsI_23600 [Oryza sativa Indica Group]|uniref:Uncharacterized protein n=1 Tax=Oryza sativa subsp. indica TaxID=39946 RepID=B8B4C3_ORYSI|nr:hypothetical protein OsI_23600 [Oryza sativa Indica Group]